MGSKEIPKKRETWDDLIDLVYAGRADHWSSLRESMNEGQAAMLRDEMKQPFVARSMTPLDPKRQNWKIEDNPAPGVVFHEPDPPQRLFCEVLVTGGLRVLHEGPDRVWLEALDDGTTVPLGTGDLVRWPLERAGLLKPSSPASALPWFARCDVVRMVAEG